MKDPTGPPPTSSQPDLFPEEIAAVENAIAPSSPDAAPASLEQAPMVSGPGVEMETGSGGDRPPDSPSGGGNAGEEDEEGTMAKMSFLEHLEELRKRIIHALLAVAVGFGVCFWFAPRIFEHLARPVTQVLTKLKMPDQLYYTHPADAFNLYLQIGLIAGLFAASPFVIYQLWAFISPGLYKHERKYAVPFVFFCSALFIAGGLFGYLVAFPFALEFLLGLGGAHLRPWLTAKEYLDLFTTITLGLGIIFELPVLILFLTLLRVVTPGFLIRNFRYAVLLIVIVAAIITPTSDITNLMVFSAPMLALYLLGTGLAWMVTFRRKKREG